ncbi:unnamed protein product [Phytomonas sp. Hart1]|nr:unnamed protein product [Phytomonas sp. Hart1]|eukprot:CCW71768.1 unnamed protein product [Phytomonas sp. isolate Hart1]
MERQGYVLLRRVALWGAVEGKKGGKRLEAVQELHQKYASLDYEPHGGADAAAVSPHGSESDLDSNACPSAHIAHGEQQKMMDLMDAHATQLGLPFRSPECFALFDAIAAYLRVLDRLKAEYPARRRPFSAVEESQTAGKGGADGRSPRPELFEIAILANYYEKEAEARAEPAGRGERHPRKPAPPTPPGKTKNWPKRLRMWWGRCWGKGGNRQRDKESPLRGPTSSRKKQKRGNFYVNLAHTARGVGAMWGKGEMFNGKCKNKLLYKTTASFSHRWSYALKGTDGFYCGGEEDPSQMPSLNLWQKESHKLFKFMAKCLERYCARRVKGKDGVDPYLRRIRIALISDKKL